LDTSKKKFQFLISSYSQKNLVLSYFALSIYVVLYTIFSLSIINLQIFPTVNRVTFFNVVVKWTITGSEEFDILLTTLIFSVAIISTFKKKLSIPISILIILFPLLSIILNLDFLQQFARISFFITFPLVIGLLVVSALSMKQEIQTKSSDKQYRQGYFDFGKFLSSVFFLIIIVELIAFLTWIIYPFLLDSPSPHWSWRINYLENNLFYAFGLLSPSLILLAILSFVIKPSLRLLFSSRVNQRPLHDSEFENTKEPEITKMVPAKTTSFSSMIEKKFSSIMSSEKNSIKYYIY